MDAILELQVSGTEHQVSETVMFSTTFIIDCVPKLHLYVVRKTVYATASLLLQLDE